MSEHTIPTYPVIRFTVRHGKTIAALLAAAIVALSLYFFVSGGGPVVVLVGLVAAVLAAGVVLSYVEVLTIIAETLMPR